MTWQVAYIIRLLLPSWPCKPVGLISLVPVTLETVFPLLLVTSFPIAILLAHQPQPVAYPLSAIHQTFPCLLESFPAAVVSENGGPIFLMDSF